MINEDHGVGSYDHFIKFKVKPPFGGLTQVFIIQGGISAANI